MFKFSKRSLNNLKEVHPDLQAVMHKALEYTPVDFVVIDGLRTVEEQKALVKSGASKTMNSRHLTGHAVDIVPWSNGSIRWDWPLFYAIEPAVKSAAKELGVDIEWGGDWPTFKDGPHWQLSRKKYP